MWQRLFLTGILALLLSAGGIAMWNAQQQIEPAAPSTPTPKENRVSGDNVLFTVTEGAAKRWDLKARKALYYPDSSGADLQGVTGAFYNDDGEVMVTFAAPAGVFVNRDSAMTLTGGVVVKSVKEAGTELQAPRMTWSAKTKSIFAQDGVRVLKKNFGESRAQTCRFPPNLSQFVLQGQAETQLSP